MVEKILVFLKIRKPINKKITAILSNGKEIDTGMKSRVRTCIYCFDKKIFEKGSDNGK